MKKGVAGELLAKEEKSLFLDEDIIFFEGKKKARVLPCRLPFLFGGDGEGPENRSPYWCLARKF